MSVCLPGSGGPGFPVLRCWLSPHSASLEPCQTPPLPLCPVLCGSPWEGDTGGHMAPAGRGSVTQGHLESHKMSTAHAISPHSPPSHLADTSSLQDQLFHLYPHQVVGTGTTAACTLLSFCIPKSPHCPSPKLGSWQGNTPSLCPASSQCLPATCWQGSPFPHLLPSHMEPNKPFSTGQRAVSLASLGYKQPYVDASPFVAMGRARCWRGDNREVFCRAWERWDWGMVAG